MTTLTTTITDGKTETTTIESESCQGVIIPPKPMPATWIRTGGCPVQMSEPEPLTNDCGIVGGSPSIEYNNFQLSLDWEPHVQTTFGPRVKDLVEYGYNLGLCDYPIYDEAFRPVLNQLITDHFWLREIGAETVEMFVFYLNRTMREIMPIYNIIFAKLADPNFDPFSNEQNTRQCANATSRDTGESNSHTSTDAVASNAPQVNIFDGQPTSIDDTLKARSRYGYWNTGQFSDSDTHATFTNDNNSLSGYVMASHGASYIGLELMQMFLSMYLNPLSSLFAELEINFCQLWKDSVNGL